MTYLFKKTLRDLRSNWTQFFSVFLMAAISVLIFSGMASVWTGLDNSVENLVNKTNMADVWVRAAGISDEDLEQIKDIQGVTDALRCMSVSVSNSEDGSEIELNVYDDSSISKPYLIDGEEYSYDSEDGIWLDKTYADKHSLQVGDSIALDGNMGEKSLAVKGIVMSPEYIYYTGSITETVPDYDDYGYAYVGSGAMLELSPAIIYTQVKLKTDETVSNDTYRDILGQHFIYAQDRETFTQYARADQESSQMQKMATLFSAVFILLALLTMYTSMSRIVNRQKTLIGTLKALGTQSRAIYLHYAAYGLIIPLLGGVLGLIAGRFTVSKALMEVKQTTIYIPEWELTHAKASFALIGLIMLCCIIAAIWAAKSCMKGMPAEIMRDNGTGQKVKKVSGDKESMSGFSYEWRWVLRNIAGNKVRFIMGIVGVMGGMVLIIAGMGVRDAINGSNDFVFTSQYQYQSKALLSTPGIGFDVEEDSQWIQESNIELQTESGEVKQTVLTVMGEGEMLNFFDDNDNKMEIPGDGIIISRKLAQDLGVSEGDTVDICLFGTDEWKTLSVVSLSKTLSPQGIFMSDSYYENQGMTFTPTALLTVSEDTEALLSLDEVRSVVTLDHQIENVNKVADSVMSIVKLLILASLLLSIVILYNLGILNYVERVRDYATMKVLGFYQKEIRSISIRECLLTTAVGWIIGLPLGVQFLKLYVKIISFETFEWIPAIKPITLVIVSLIIIAASIVVNLVLSRKVRKIVMVEALKSVE